jgi:tripartite-type tricarboxylate transporter receptor subunit TctC
MTNIRNTPDRRSLLDQDRRRLLRAAVVLPAAGGLVTGGLGVTGAISSAQAQDAWPSRPMRCIVAFGAGGVLDITTRVVTEQMASQLGQPVVVENRGGASGNIGTDWVLRAPADGYTWMACSPYLVTNPLLTPNTKWKTTDFVGIGLIGAPPNVFVVPASLPVRTMRELVDHVKARPGALNVSNPSFGSSNHLGQELLFSLTGMEMQNVLYKTQAEMLPGIINGEVAMGLCTIALALPHIKDGRLRALAISAPRRSRELPDVPTIGEAGYPDAMFLPWFGMVAAAGTPKPLLMRLSAEMQKALTAPEVVARLEKMGAQLTPANGDQFDELIASETQRWSEVIRKRNIRPVG